MTKTEKSLIAVLGAVVFLVALHSFGSDIIVPTPTGIAMCASTAASGIDVDMGSCTGGVIIPSGTTGQRPPNTIGAMRYNTTTSQMELYSGAVWNNMMPVAQVNSDWNAGSGVAQILNRPSLATVQAYEGTTQRLNAFPVFKSATVSSGTAVFNLTTDGTSGGTALFPNGVIMDSTNVLVNDNSASYQMSWAWSNSNKTVTVTANKYTTVSLLSGILGQTPANGAVVKLEVWGY